MRSDELNAIACHDRSLEMVFLGSGDIPHRVVGAMRLKIPSVSGRCRPRLELGRNRRIAVRQHSLDGLMEIFVCGTNVEFSTSFLALPV
jgi:hypothetical protein